MEAIHLFALLILLGFTEVSTDFGQDAETGHHWQKCAEFDELGWEILPPPNGKLFLLLI